MSQLIEKEQLKLLNISELRQYASMLQDLEYKINMDKINTITNMDKIRKKIICSLRRGVCPDGVCKLATRGAGSGGVNTGPEYPFKTKSSCIKGANSGGISATRARQIATALGINIKGLNKTQICDALMKMGVALVPPAASSIARPPPPPPVASSAARPPPPPPAARPPPGGGGDCGPYTRSELLKMKMPALTNLLKKSNISSGYPRTKKGKIDYLCRSLEGNEGKCNSPDWNCPPGYDCDASSSYDDEKNGGVCVPSNWYKHENSMNYKGNKIVGTKKAIQKLKNILKESSSSSSQPPPPPSVSKPRPPPPPSVSKPRPPPPPVAMSQPLVSGGVLLEDKSRRKLIRKIIKKKRSVLGKEALQQLTDEELVNIYQQAVDVPGQTPEDLERMTLISEILILNPTLVREQYLTNSIAELKILKAEIEKEIADKKEIIVVILQQENNDSTSEELMVNTFNRLRIILFKLKKVQRESKLQALKSQQLTIADMSSDADDTDTDSDEDDEPLRPAKPKPPPPPLKPKPPPPPLKPKPPPPPSRSPPQQAAVPQAAVQAAVQAIGGGKPVVGMNEIERLIMKCLGIN